LSWVALDYSTEDGAVLVDKLASFVDLLTGKCGTVDFDFSFWVCFFPSFGVTENIAHAVDNVTIGIDLLASELLGITISDLTNLLTRRNNVTVLLNDSVGEVFEWTRLFNAALIRWNRLCLTDDVSYMRVLVIGRLLS